MCRHAVAHCNSNCLASTRFTAQRRGLLVNEVRGTPRCRIVSEVHEQAFPGRRSTLLPCRGAGLRASRHDGISLTECRPRHIIVAGGKCRWPRLCWKAQRLQPNGCNPPSCGRKRLSCGHLAGVSLPRRRGVHFHFAGETGRDLAVMGMHRCNRKRAQVRAKPGYPNRSPTRRHLCEHIILQDRFR